MRIEQVLYSAGRTGFFFDDQQAIKGGAAQDGFVYLGEPQTPGFERIRQAGESISVMLLLEDGQVAVGDCAAVQYSGAGGRDPLFLAGTYIPWLRRHVSPLLEGRQLGRFRDLAAEIDGLRVGEGPGAGRPAHTALRYGLSQALLDACARAARTTMTEVLCAEYGLPVTAEPVPVFAQSGDDRYANVDKMILKEADVLPHGLINSVERKLGRRGEKLAEYLAWLSGRILRLRRDERYRPDLHLDVYGTVGLIFDHDPARIAAYLASLAGPAGPFRLYIEGPVDMGERGRQVETLLAVRRELERRGSAVKIVADEWCNTLEDIREFVDARCCHMVQIKTPDLGSVHNVVESVLYCREHGMEAYQGGTCNETDLSARACVHLALAARAERLLAKPGMGFDEGFAVVKNEMERTLALLRARTGPRSARASAAPALPRSAAAAAKGGGGPHG